MSPELRWIKETSKYLNRIRRGLRNPVVVFAVLDDVAVTKAQPAGEL
jgi:hypothetical protein